MNDSTSRQAAIDIVVYECGKWTGLAKEISKQLKQLPSAQPEIIYCKDCKWKQGAECVRFADVRPFPSDFCSRAERREE